MPSITFFSLLNEGHKLDTYEKRMLLTISAYPHTDTDTQERIRDSLTLPDDLLSDIVDDEETDDINILRKELENGY